MRKLTSDIIFSPQWGFRKDLILVVHDDGRIEDMHEAAGGHSDEEIEKYSGLLCPGFVNSHCHIELSWMKDLIKEGEGLHKFILDMVRLGNQQPKESIRYTAMEVAEKSMKEDGIVAVGDISNSTFSLPLKKKKNLDYHHFVEVFGSHPANAGHIFMDAMEQYNIALDLPSSITPHSLYSVSTKLLQIVIDEARQQHSIVSLHQQENEDENDLFQRGEGKVMDRIRSFYPDEDIFHAPGKKALETFSGVLEGIEHMLLVHNTVSDESDIRKALKTFRNVWFVLCPNANLFIENRLPDINMIRENSKNIALGTDSLASNHQLSILGEVKTIINHFPSIPLEEVLGWATINGAKALRMDDRLGSFERGKSPGIVHINQLDSAGKLTNKSVAKRIL